MLFAGMVDYVQTKKKFGNISQSFNDIIKIDNYLKNEELLWNDPEQNKVKIYKDSPEQWNNLNDRLNTDLTSMFEGCKLGTSSE